MRDFILGLFIGASVTGVGVALWFNSLEVSIGLIVLLLVTTFTVLSMDKYV